MGRERRVLSDDDVAVAALDDPLDVRVLVTTQNGKFGRVCSNLGVLRQRHRHHLRARFIRALADEVDLFLGPASFDPLDLFVELAETALVLRQSF